MTCLCNSSNTKRCLSRRRCADLVLQVTSELARGIRICNKNLFNLNSCGVSRSCCNLSTRFSPKQNKRTTTAKMLALIRSEAMRQPHLLRPSSPPASTLPGPMSMMVLQTLLDNASQAKSLVVSDLLVLLTLDSHKAFII